MTETMQWQQTYEIPRDPREDEPLLAAPYITAFADHPGKAILATHLTLNPEVNERGLTPAEMAQTLKKLAGLSRRLPAYTDTVDWCKGPFRTYGAVEPANNGTTTSETRFRLTPGGSLGAVLSIAMLLFAEDANVNMPFMGRAQRRPNSFNPHYNRINLMRYLVNTEASLLTQDGAAASLGGGVCCPDKVTVNALMDMYGSGMLRFTPNSRLDSTYTVNSEFTKVPLRSGAKQFSAAIAEYVSTKDAISLDEVAAHLKKTNLVTDMTGSLLRIRVAQTLMHFVDMGRLNRTAHRRQDGTIQCYFTEAQRTNLTELVCAIDAFEKRDTTVTDSYLIEGQELLSDTDRVRDILAHGSLIRPKDANGFSLKTDQGVEWALRYGGAQTAMQATEFLAKCSPSPRSPSQVDSSLENLLKTGRVVVEVRPNGSKVYSLTC